MRLFHGSTTIVKKPLVHRGRRTTDFGQGFYLTTSCEQAERWARLKQKRDGARKAVVSVYEFDKELLNDTAYKVLQYEGPSKEWLDFVVSNRKGFDLHQYDYVMGPVANDQLYTTISLYEQGSLSVEAAIIQLKSHLLFDQLSCHTEKAIKNIEYIESKEII